MCGILGIIDFQRNRDLLPSLQRGCDALRHRGPDDEGYVVSRLQGSRPLVLGGEATAELVYGYPVRYAPSKPISAKRISGLGPSIGLANRRLAILDLSPAGHQPMCNENGDMWIVHNGEIFNYQELREELKNLGYRFASSTDTEVILHAYEEWGEDCLLRFNGMWAFVLWDRKKDRLFCARDRFGIKPFYYTFDGSHLCFASEIKSLLAVAPELGEVNESVLLDYLDQGLVDHTEDTFFRKVKQLRPAHVMSVDLATQQIATRQYWIVRPSDQISDVGDQEYARRFKELLLDSVKIRLRSDVVLGGCLSGGLDSSSIVCLVSDYLEEQLLGPLETFSVLFERGGYDRSFFVDAVLEKCDLKGHKLVPTPEAFLGALHAVVEHHDEPFNSGTVVAKWILMQMAGQRGQKVLLDGQGCDEILGGYLGFLPAYFADLIHQGRVLSFLRELRVLSREGNINSFETFGYTLGYALPGWAKRAAKTIRSRKPAPWMRVQQTVGRSYPVKLPDHVVSHLERRQYETLMIYALPSYLRYDDMNSMSFSLEVRHPFLDHRLVEFGFSLPRNQCLREGWTKYLLRQSMDGILPEVIRKRREKIGFATPQVEWLQLIVDQGGEDLFYGGGTIIGDLLNKEYVAKLMCKLKNGDNMAADPMWRIMNATLWMQTGKASA